ncbi:MAG: hypothetical protein GXO29_05900 [Thermotogae bacterium]|nr:hypothetical protein [Thermotogota bacterium]
MLTDLLFADNPWWLGREVPPPERLLPISETPGILRFWIPVGGISPKDLKGMLYGWSKRWGQYSAMLIDLQRIELPPTNFADILDFYTSRLHVSSDRHLIAVNGAQWIDEALLGEYLDETYTVVLIYHILPDMDFRAILPYYPDSPSPGDVREAFWRGDVERAISLLRGYGKPLERRLKSYLWRYVVGFPPDERFYSMAVKMYALIHEYYDVREKGLFRKVLSYVMRSAGGRFKYREAAESLSLRFETLRAFIDQMISVGLIYEVTHVNRESPRSPRIILPGNGQFYHLLRHTDTKEILMLDENSKGILVFLLPYVVGKALEMGYEVSFEDDEGRHLRFRGNNDFSLRLGEDVSYVEVVGLL